MLLRFRFLGVASVIVFELGCFSPAQNGTTGSADSSTSTSASSESTTGATTTTTADPATETSAPSDDSGSTTTTVESTSSSGDSSTGEPAARCNPDAAFGEPEPIAEVNSRSIEQGAWLTADELTMYLDSTRPGGAGLLDIFVATRASIDDDFEEPVALAGVNTPGYEADGVLTTDGLRLYASQHDGMNWNVVVATRADTDDAFGALSTVPELNSANLDANPFPAANGSVYFTSDRQGSWDLFHATWNGADFDEPEPVPGVDLASGATDAGPILTPDELTIYFSSNRFGSAGGLDIYVAVRASTDDAFDPTTQVSELATEVDDVVTWVSADGCEVLMHRSEPAADDVLVARRGM